jgi:hypothetical protein
VSAFCHYNIFLSSIGPRINVLPILGLEFETAGFEAKK